MNSRPLPYQGSALPLSYNGWFISSTAPRPARIQPITHFQTPPAHPIRHPGRLPFEHIPSITPAQPSPSACVPALTLFCLTRSADLIAHPFSTGRPAGYPGFSWSGRRGSNPRPTAWKAVALPTELLPHESDKTGGQGWIRTTELRRGQIYSLLPLATWLLARLSKMCGRCTSNKNQRISRKALMSVLSDNPPPADAVGRFYLPRAREVTRTPDQLITNQLLYQLSYSGL